MLLYALGQAVHTQVAAFTNKPVQSDLDQMSVKFKEADVVPEQPSISNQGSPVAEEVLPDQEGFSLKSKIVDVNVKYNFNYEEINNLLISCSKFFKEKYESFSSDFKNRFNHTEPGVMLNYGSQFFKAKYVAFKNVFAEKPLSIRIENDEIPLTKELAEIDPEAFSWGSKIVNGHVKYSSSYRVPQISLLSILAIGAVIDRTPRMIEVERQRCLDVLYSSNRVRAVQVLCARVLLGVGVGMLATALATRHYEEQADRFAIQNSSEKELMGAKRMLSSLQQIHKEKAAKSDTTFSWLEVNAHGDKRFSLSNASTTNRLKKIEKALSEARGSKGFVNTPEEDAKIAKLKQHLVKY